MQFVKFIDPDTGFTYSVYECEESGVVGYQIGKDCVDSYAKLDESHFTTEPINAEKNMLNYANENGLIPVVVCCINTDSILTFQGNVLNAKDCIELDADQLKEKVVQYFDLKKEVESLDDEEKIEVKKLKEQYSDHIASLTVLMQEIEPVVSTGFESVECSASWERDAAAEKMILVRRDNLKTLQIRPMEGDELHPDMFDNADNTDIETDPETVIED